MKKNKNKKGVVILSFVLLSLSLIAIGMYLYKNPNIREKLSFASTIGLNSKKTPSLPIEPLYKFVDFKTLYHGNVSKSVKLDDGREIVGGYTVYRNNNINGDFPVLWNREGEIIRYMFIEKYKYGYFYDMNENGDFTTQYIALNDYPLDGTSYLHNIDSDQVIELKSPNDSLPLASSSLLKNEALLKTKEYFETLIPDGIGTEIFENIHSVGEQISPKSINNNGDVAGSVYLDKNGVGFSIGVLWLASNEHKPLDISTIIASQLGTFEETDVMIYSIDDNRNIFAGADIKGVSKVGYFEYVSGNQWKLKQSWSSPKNSYTYTPASNNDYVVISREEYQGGGMVTHNFIYQKKKDNRLGRLISRNPYTYKFEVEDLVQDFVDEEILSLWVQGINKDNEIVGGFHTKNVFLDFFTIDLDTKTVQIFSQLADTGLVVYPEGVRVDAISASSIDDDGNIYVQYSGGGVGMLQKL